MKRRDAPKFGVVIRKLKKSMPVIFDMDGVLFNSEPIHLRSWQKTIKPLQIMLPDEWFLEWIGIPDQKLAEYILRHYPVSLTPEQLLGRKRKAYRTISSKSLKAFPGIKTGLKALSKKGISVALATTTLRKEAEHILSCTGLQKYFTHRVTGDDVTHKKPAPDPFLKAARLLHTPANQCWAIEDSLAGIESAHRAGCRVLAITSSLSAKQLKGAYRVFSKTTEAIDWILKTDGK
jgi:beta-phosphoglucomutase family hydrolase